MSLRLSLNDWFAKYFKWHSMEPSNASRSKLRAQHNTAQHSTSPRLAQVSESTSPKHSHIPNKRSQTFAPSRLQGGARKSVGRDDGIGILQMVTC